MRDDQRFVLREAQRFSEGTSVERGVIQGGKNSPISFSIIVDSVLRTWKKAVGEDLEESISLSAFCADDGLLENSDPGFLQKYLNIVVD